MHQQYGVDLLDFFNGRYTPRKLGVLLDGLPRDSHLSTAKSQDTELARLLENKPKRKTAPPELFEFSREQELLIAVYYLLCDIRSGVMASAGSKKKPPKPHEWEVPESASAKLARQRRREAHEHVLSRLNFTSTKGGGR